MSEEHSTVIVNKHFVSLQPFEINLSKTQRKAIKWMTKRLVNEGLLTTLEDLTQFVRSKKSHQDGKNNAAVRKFVSRLVAVGAAEALGNGVYIPKGYREFLKDTNIKLLAKIKSKRQKNTIIRARSQILNLIKPYLISRENKWTYLLTQINVRFKVNGLYEKLIELNNVNSTNQHNLIINVGEDKRVPNLKAAFNVYPNYVRLKIGTPECPLRASESIIFSALSITRNYLVNINRYWHLNLDIPSGHDWLLSIPYLYCQTVNEDYTAFGGTIKNDRLGLSLVDYKKHLCFKINLPSTQLKPSQLVGVLNQYDPLKMLNIDPKTFPNFHAHFVTILEHAVTNPLSKDGKQMNKEGDY